MLCRKSRIAVWSSVVAVGSLVSAQAAVLSGSSRSESRFAPLLEARLFLDAAVPSSSPISDHPHEQHGWDIKFELGHSSANVSPPDAFDHDPLRSGLTGFVTYNPHQVAAATNDPSRSEWEYLWRDPACVPIHAVPEPTTAVLIGAGALLWLLRQRRGN